MNRRNILAMSGVTVLSVLAAGRMAKAQSGTAESSAGGSSAAGTTLSEKTYETQTLTVGTLAKEASQLALTNASHPKVKEFAQFEVAEQTTIAQALTRTANPLPLPPPLAAKLAQLHMASGKAFDAAYVQAQIEGHQQLLDIQQEFLNGNPQNLDREHIAMLARTVIQMHITMLEDLQQILGAA